MERADEKEKKATRCELVVFLSNYTSHFQVNVNTQSVKGPHTQ